MFERVTVVGLGVIGGSIAGALRSSGRRVFGFDIAPRNSRLALQRGLIDEPCLELEDALHHSELAVLAVPVRAILDLLPTVDRLLPTGGVILDTGSVKGPVIETMGALAGGERAVGGHPLAGKEQSGPEAADTDLFRGRPFALVPNRRTGREALATAEAVVRAIGAEPVLVDADRHDAVLSRTSHLPQILSTALALSLRPDDTSLAGTGLADMTRLASSDPVMWRDILLTNREHVLEASHRYIGRLEELVRVIEDADAAGIETLLRSGNARCAMLKSGGAA